MDSVVAHSAGRSVLLRRFRAATVLAALYTLGVVALLVLLAAIDDWRLYIDDLRSTLRSFGVLFAIACIILALARRVGFVALWVLLCTLWAFLLSDSDGYSLPFEFVKWSMLAFPLYLISAFPFARAIPVRIGRWTVAPVVVIGGLLIALAIAGFILRDYAYPPAYTRISDSPVPAFLRVDSLGWLFWAPAPFLIAVVCVTAMWVGSRDRSGEGSLTRA